MKSLYKSLAILLLLLVYADQSFACRVMLPPKAKIAFGDFDAVVVGRVTQAQYTGEIAEDYRPWNGTVRLETVIRGEVQQDTFSIDRSGSLTACDDGQPVPPAGEAWALYLRGRSSELRVVYSFPLRVACMADPALPEAICKVPREEMIAQLQRDEERRRVEAEERRRRQKEEARAGCELPKASERAKVVVLSAFRSDSVSTTTLGSQDVAVGSGFITIEAGEEPLYVVVTSSQPVIWRFSGALARLERVVLVSATNGAASSDRAGKPLVGATGLPVEKVTFLPRPNCLDNFYEESSADAAETLATVKRETGKDAISAARYEVSGFTVSSAVIQISEPTNRMSLIIKSAGSVHVIGEAMVVIPGNSAALDSLVEHSYPGGVVEIDPTHVVADVAPVRYDVLPGMAGLRQLVQRGALAWNRDGEFLIKQKIRFPAELSGAHSAHFVLPRGVPEPDGEARQSCVMSEETGKPLRGSQC